MITSKKISDLVEKYVRIYNQPVEVLEDPSFSEIGSLCSELRKTGKEVELRFIADSNTKKFYVWPSYLGTHDQVGKLLGLPISNLNYPALCGFYNLVGAFVKARTDNNIISYGLSSSSAFNYDWNWINKYFSKNDQKLIHQSIEVRKRQYKPIIGIN